MENQTQTKQPSQQEIEAATQNWIRNSLGKANKHLAEKGIIPNAVLDKESRYMAPMCAVWKIKSQKGKTYWVVSGDLPTDHVEVTAATSARDAMRYFSFQWQLKAEEVAKHSGGDKTQLEFANLLINRAHGLYQLFEDEKLWANEPK